MGVSTDAMLIYGIAWDEELSLLPESVGEWSEVILEKRGVASPWSEFREPDPDRFGWRERDEMQKKWFADNRQRLDEGYALKRAVEAEFGCDIDYHCSDGCSMPLVKVRGRGVDGEEGVSAVARSDAVGDGRDDAVWRLERDAGTVLPGVGYHTTGRTETGVVAGKLVGLMVWVLVQRRTPCSEPQPVKHYNEPHSLIREK